MKPTALLAVLGVASTRLGSSLGCQSDSDCIDCHSHDPVLVGKKPLPENLACCTPKYCAAAEVTKPDRSRYIERGCIEKKDWEACDKNCRTTLREDLEGTKKVACTSAEFNVTRFYTCLCAQRLCNNLDWLRREMGFDILGGIRPDNVKDNVAAANNRIDTSAVLEFAVLTSVIARTKYK